MKYIYLDACCLCRPFDDKSHERIFIESESIMTMLSHFRDYSWTMVGSDLLEYELLRILNFDKLEKVMDLYSLRGTRIILTDPFLVSSQELQCLGLKLFDSLHLALAESFDENVVLLTTDDFFLKVASRIEVKILVENPATWLMEVMSHEP
jgi:hypothetical protein